MNELETSRCFRQRICNPSEIHVGDHITEVFDNGQERLALGSYKVVIEPHFNEQNNALAMTVMGDKSLPRTIFFIDRGFGPLDDPRAQRTTYPIFLEKDVPIEVE